MLALDGLLNLSETHAVIESYRIKVIDLRQITNNPRLGMMQRPHPLTVRRQMADSNTK